MPEPSEGAKPGLGTSIVEALAHRLQAAVRITNANPGTMVAIVHNQIVLVEDVTDEPREIHVAP
jgi:hypothetical protein